MIRKFEHGILCLRNKDKSIVNLYPVTSATRCFYYTICNPGNQVFVETNPLLAPRALADWSYNE
jgi:hypothetical protein